MATFWRSVRDIFESTQSVVFGLDAVFDPLDAAVRGRLGLRCLADFLPPDRFADRLPDLFPDLFAPLLITADYFPVGKNSHNIFEFYW